MQAATLMPHAVATRCPPPVKTPRGRKELRDRMRRLGQRHRTVLLLVDGRRSMSEVLRLGEQAGAAPKHFDELLDLGLVALPQPVLLQDELRIDEPMAQARAAVPAAAEPEAAPQEQEREPACDTAPETPLPSASPDETALATARDLMIEMLCLDAPFSMLRLRKQIRAAQNLYDLADLLAHIERKVTPIQRSHEGRLCLERVRELLGLGNTQVWEDTVPFLA